MAKRSNIPGAAPASKRARTGVRLLRGVLAGLLAAALGLAGVCAMLPAQTAYDPARLYDYVYSGTKSQSVPFTTASMSDDGHLAFGSSEFFISKDKVAQCPQAVFGENVTGVDLTYVGEAYDQSLWQAIAAGAYAGEAKNKKVMIVVSPQWFFKGNGDQGKFASKFSYELYRRFANNPSISGETKAYVRSRVEALGVDAKTTAAANRDTVLDAASTGEPDWNALLKQADASGDAACTTNDFGIYDAYWQKNSGYHVERGQNFSQADEEYADLACFLRVCREAGLEPLVTILPVHGAWYDREGVAHAERQAYYERIHGLCDDAGAAYADFSSCEYEKYFLCDTVHPGWCGWVRIEQAFYDFVHDRDDAFLGGGRFGAAEGLDAAGNAGASLAGVGGNAGDGGSGGSAS